MKKMHFLLGLLLIILLFFAVSDGQAQDDSNLVLRLRRDWGYGSGSDIQGNMTLYIDGDLSTVEQVVYTIDDVIMAELTEEPFRFSFNTDSYEPGPRQMRAEVTRSNGTMISIGPIVYNFLSAAESGEKTTNIIVVIVGITLVAAGISWFVSRQKGGSTVGGGMHGLAVCNRCGKTFPRSFFGMNVVVGKFERCPHCGKWQITRRASPWEIEMADEQNRPKESVDITPKPEKDDLEESRFIDM